MSNCKGMSKAAFKGKNGIWGIPHCFGTRGRGKKRFSWRLLGRKKGKKVKKPSSMASKSAGGHKEIVRGEERKRVERREKSAGGPATTARKRAKIKEDRSVDREKKKGTVQNAKRRIGENGSENKEKKKKKKK